MSDVYKQEEVEFRNDTQGGQKHNRMLVADESGGNIRDVKRLLAGRVYSRDRRKRQKLVNEYNRNQNVELKAIVRRQAEELKELKQQVGDELKELKSRNANLECGLRQACVDNLTLLNAQIDSQISSFPKQVQKKQERQYENPTWSSLLDSFMLSTPACSSRLKDTSPDTAACTGIINSNISTNNIKMSCSDPVMLTPRHSQSNSNTCEDPLLELFHFELQRLQQAMLQVIRQYNSQK